MLDRGRMSVAMFKVVTVLLIVGRSIQVCFIQSPAWTIRVIAPGRVGHHAFGWIDHSFPVLLPLWNVFLPPFLLLFGDDVLESHRACFGNLIDERMGIFLYILGVFSIFESLVTHRPFLVFTHFRDAHSFGQFRFVHEEMRTVWGPYFPLLLDSLDHLGLCFVASMVRQKTCFSWMRTVFSLFALFNVLILVRICVTRITITNIVYQLCLVIGKNRNCLVLIFVW